MNRILSLGYLSALLLCPGALAAELSPRNPPSLPRDLPPSTKPLEDPDDLIRRQPESHPLPLPPTSTPSETAPQQLTTFRVRHFKVTGSQQLSQSEIDQITASFLNRPITFAEVLQARSAITDRYQALGFLTSGAYVPEQEIEDNGDILITVVEGSLEAINVEGTQRLNPGYIRSRLAIATAPPLNQNRLLEALQLLRLNPLIANLSAELAASPYPGRSILTVKIQEAPTWNGQIQTDNGRSPSVGTDRRRVQLSQANLLGLGDSLLARYTNTNGSNTLDLSYTLPLSPHNTTLSFNYGTSRSRVVEKPFDVLEITSRSQYAELTLRQPFQQSPTAEGAIGLTVSHQVNQTELGLDNIGPFPLSPGADDEGRTRISALRFFQEWTQRSSQQVLALRSQFSVGVNAFNATINDTAPDSRFFAWRGQAQWVHLLGDDPEALLLLRTDLQLADRPLLTAEQFGLGGFESVRGYRQDALLTDNGIFASTELRLPIVRIPNWRSTLSLVPFLEVGHGWNRDRGDPSPNTLLATGLGLRWRIGDRILARFDWGLPLISTKAEKRTLQENGFYFSLLWNPF